MVWANIWSYDVDGTELNDASLSPNGLYVCMVPEIQNSAPRTVILQERDGDTPVFIRSQVQAGSYTFLIAMKDASVSDWDTRFAALQTLFDLSSYHTLTVKVRGMPEPKSVQFIVENLQADFKTRTVVVSTVAPNPVLT